MNNVVQLSEINELIAKHVSGEITKNELELPWDLSERALARLERKNITMSLASRMIRNVWGSDQRIGQDVGQEQLFSTDKGVYIWANQRITRYDNELNVRAVSELLPSGRIAANVYVGEHIYISTTAARTTGAAIPFNLNITGYDLETLERVIEYNVPVSPTFTATMATALGPHGLYLIGVSSGAFGHGVNRAYSVHRLSYDGEHMSRDNVIQWTRTDIDPSTIASVSGHDPRFRLSATNRRVIAPLFVSAGLTGHLRVVPFISVDPITLEPETPDRTTIFGDFGSFPEPGIAMYMFGHHRGTFIQTARYISDEHDPIPQMGPYLRTADLIQSISIDAAIADDDGERLIVFSGGASILIGSSDSTSERITHNRFIMSGTNTMQTSSAIVLRRYIEDDLDVVFVSRIFNISPSIMQIQDMSTFAFRAHGIRALHRLPMIPADRFAICNGHLLVFFEDYAISIPPKGGVQV